jgi:hypothetical protein
MLDVVETAEARFTQALSLLREGRFADAWPLYEARKNLDRIDLFHPITTMPEWAGEDPSGKRVVVCAEQGFGDQIMWGRYLGLLRDAGADVVVVCHPRLMRLFETLGFWTRPCFTDQPIPEGDYWTHFGSLPLRLGAFEPPEPNYFGLTGSGGGVGVLTFAGQPNRTLPPRQRDQLLSLGRDLSPQATGAFDFFDTARIVAELDLVISVDTAVANLSASLGKPTWVLLPPHPDFRWGPQGGRSAWYPDVVQFRQSQSGNWQSVLAQVVVRMK